MKNSSNKICEESIFIKASFNITYTPQKSKHWVFNKQNLLFSGQWQPLLI